MKVVKVSKNLLNPVRLPGMGRSIEVFGLSESEVLEIRSSFTRRELVVEFEEQPGQQLPVVQLWANPHGSDVTLFV
ncbi:hypothetical protein [Alicyclobacillus sp. ALC3]|uniref:hypothetical protein n=1 Tax=Alicyclobacillus sp. ALC3 TaxID=2796143 RepID=UPI00237972E4|nr:hypothetical protein [Alicyclobacillus sp. ALC3]WDL97541.1 hypothetical protein JC200_02080 [Alicyclobacillus sp. ALC3]